MSTDPTPTIIDLKLAFLQRQIQALSQPITLPRNYKPEDEDHALRQKSINDALEKVNLKLREHNHLVYSAQAQRHVAEQIDALYWRSAERAAEGMESEGSLQVGMDFTAENEIIALPETWEDEDEAANSPEQALQYAAKVQQLKELNERRASLRRKVADMKLLKEKLAPFENPKENVQQNLVTKNGEVERELEKMRMLLARVKGRLETLPATSGDGVEDIEVDVDMDAKVLDLLQNGF